MLFRTFTFKRYSQSAQAVGQGGKLALSQLALADLCMGLQLLRLKQYAFTGAPAPVALAPPFAIRNFAAWGLSDPAGAPEPQAETNEAAGDINSTDAVPIELHPLVDASSGDEALAHHHVEDGHEPDSDDDGTCRPLLVESMLASGRYFIVPVYPAMCDVKHATLVADPPAEGNGAGKVAGDALRIKHLCEDIDCSSLARGIAAPGSTSQPSGAETPDDGQRLPSEHESESECMQHLYADVVWSSLALGKAARGSTSQPSGAETLGDGLAGGHTRPPGILGTATVATAPAGSQARPQAAPHADSVAGSHTRPPGAAESAHTETVDAEVAAGSHTRPPGAWTADE